MKEELYGTDEQITDFVIGVVSDYKASPEYQKILDAHNYYKDSGKLIHGKLRHTIGKGGAIEIDNVLPNNKISYPFYNEICDIKASYAFGRGYSLESNDEVTGALVSSLLDSLNFQSELLQIATKAYIYGVSFVEVSISKTGLPIVNLLPNTEMLCLNENGMQAETGDIDLAVRFYKIQHFHEKNKIDTLDVYEIFLPTKKIIISQDPFMHSKYEVVHKPYGTVTESNVDVKFSMIPIFTFKTNITMTPPLHYVKNMIDAYDSAISNMADNLADISYPIYVLKNYGGTDLGEFRNNLQKFKAVKVSGDGDITIISPRMDVATVNSHTNDLKTSIYDALRCVSPEEERNGTASGKALDRMYNKMNIDANTAHTNFQQTTKLLLEFFAKSSLGLLGVSTKGLPGIIFNSDLAVNEDTIITNAQKSMGIISQKTIVANHPWVKDVDRELEMLKREQEQQQQDPYAGAFGNLDPSILEQLQIEGAQDESNQAADQERQVLAQ